MKQIIAAKASLLTKNKGVKSIAMGLSSLTFWKSEPYLCFNYLSPRLFYLFKRKTRLYIGNSRSSMRTATTDQIS